MPLERREASASAIDILDRVLDKGIVVDYYPRVSVLGIDLATTIDSRITVASMDTYLGYALGPRRIDDVWSVPPRW